MKQSLQVPVQAVLALVIAGMVLGACGGGGGGGGEPATKPLAEQQPSTATEPASGAASASTAPASAVAAAASESQGTAPNVGSSASASAPGSSATASPSLPTAAPGTGQSSSSSGGGSGGAQSGGTTAAAPTAGPSGTGNASAGGSGGVPGAAITAGSDTTAADSPPPPVCAIDERRYFGGSCWANIKDTIAYGSNRSYSNARPTHTGTVNANCIGGKVYWSTGLCRSNAAAAAAPLAAEAERPPPTAYKIGTYYFPGWKDNQSGAPAKFPWARIKDYPEREPKLGWYDDGLISVVEQQMKWMVDYGLDYVVFDWYWNGKGIYLHHTLDAYFRTESRKKLPFALLWSNHTNTPQTKLEFTSMVDFWIKSYFDRPEYLKIDSKPVIFVFSHPDFVRQAKQFGETVPALLADAQARAKEAGYKGIYFVGGTHVDTPLLKSGEASGYSAFSGYNYHGRADDSSTSFEELDSAYQHVWDEVLKHSPLPYIVPMTQGWDKRPWGPSSNPLHDLSGGVVGGFEQHLIAARRLMDANPSKTMRMGVICCWNEFGEGSYIEPTKKDGFSYLEKVQKVFGSP